MSIVFTGKEKGGEHPILHDLNFQKNRYEAVHPFVRPQLQHSSTRRGLFISDGHLNGC